MLSIKVITPRHSLKGLRSEMFVWKCPNCDWEIRQLFYEETPLRCFKCNHMLPDIKFIVNKEHFRAKWHQNKELNKNPIYSIYKHSGD